VGPRTLYLLTLLALLGSALMAGAFFAFSAFVMRALARLPPSQGIAAMQSINRVVLNPVFVTVFLGNALLCAILTVACFAVSPPRPGAALAGALLYLLGTFGVTIAFNVPRNDALAKVDATSPAAEALWASYVRTWTGWNHVRTMCALAATAAFSLALT
jgi:uncharacterized membrane protein